MIIESLWSGCNSYKKENSYTSSDGNCLHVFFSRVWISYENGRALLDGLPRTQLGKVPSFPMRKANNAQQTHLGTHSYAMPRKQTHCICHVKETKGWCNPDLNSHETVTASSSIESHAALCGSNVGRLNTFLAYLVNLLQPERQTSLKWSASSNFKQFLVMEMTEGCL